MVTDTVLDLIMSKAKHYIFRWTCPKVTLNFVFQRKSSRAVLEKHIWSMTDCLTMNFSLRYPYFPLINDIL